MRELHHSRHSLKEALTPNPRMIAEAAERRGIPWIHWKDLNLLQLGIGKRRQWIRAMTTSLEPDVAVELAQDKQVTKHLLHSFGLRVPRGRIVNTPEDAVRWLPELGGNVVIKPLDGHKGSGVSSGLKSPERVREAFELARPHSRSVLLEEHVPGNDYRLLIIGQRLFAAALRIPAQVVGDGVHTIQKLVEFENASPFRGTGPEKPMTAIPLDPIARACLREENLDFNSIPSAGRIVSLRKTANLSKGASARDVTDEVHPEFREIAEKSAKMIGLALCGVDLIAEDIARTPEKQRWAIIEVNAGPGIRLHHFPASGQARDAGGAIVDWLFPPGEDGRIPILAIADGPEQDKLTQLLSGCLKSAKVHPCIANADDLFPALANPMADVVVVRLGARAPSLPLRFDALISGNPGQDPMSIVINACRGLGLAMA